MNLRDYYLKEQEYTSKELNNYIKNPSDSNRTKILNKRQKFKDIIIKEHNERIVHLMDVEMISAGMINTQEERDQLIHDRIIIERIDL